jgi:hypothetical protein
MARLPKIEQNKILADLIQRWSSKYGFLADPYTSRLTFALRENQNLSMWSTVDPFNLLPFPAPTVGSSLRKIASTLGAIRNALVFAPVAFTWLAVGQATSAFQIFVEKNVNATVNFLEFWQNGYGELASEWRISTVAVTDATIVFVVISLSVFSNYLENRAVLQNEVEDHLLLDERTELALAIKDYLFTKQNVSKLTLNQGVATAIENLVSATENLQKRRRRS